MTATLRLVCAPQMENVNVGTCLWVPTARLFYTVPPRLILLIRYIKSNLSVSNFIVSVFDMT